MFTKNLSKYRGVKNIAQKYVHAPTLWDRMVKQTTRGHYTLYNSLKNLSPTILDVFKFPGLFVKDFTKISKIV